MASMKGDDLKTAFSAGQCKAGCCFLEASFSPGKGLTENVREFRGQLGLAGQTMLFRKQKAASLGKWNEGQGGLEKAGSAVA